MSAAQTAVILAALHEDELPDAQAAKDQDLRLDQPRITDRAVLLAIARQNDPGVVDVRAD